MVSERCWQNSISDVIIEIKDGEECRRPNENKTKFKSHFAGATSKRLVKIHLKFSYKSFMRLKPSPVSKQIETFSESEKDFISK